MVLHLVSHASGELVELVARNAVAQLADARVDRNTWKFVRSLGQLPEILVAIAAKPGFVFHSLSAVDLRQSLEEGCSNLHLPCMFVLEPFVSRLAEHFTREVHFRASARDVIDEDYYRRVEAMKYALSHDDGVGSEALDDADVVLLGVSRATKTPTCMYLASCGVKAANVPLVPGVPLPENIQRLKGPLVVGLTVDPARLARVRKARLESFGQKGEGDYADFEAISQELREARRMIVRRGWSVIDVTSRSIEQTAGMILDLLAARRKRAQEHDPPA
jgi:regulator of PEP synthase PpsR (kinase-PPPase family)